MQEIKTSFLMPDELLDYYAYAIAERKFSFFEKYHFIYYYHLSNDEIKSLNEKLLNLKKLMTKTECSGCGAEIKFVKSKAGKWLPIDADVVESDGTMILYVDELTGFKKLPAGRKGHLSHFASCPEANKFRKPK